MSDNISHSTGPSLPWPQLLARTETLAILQLDGKSRIQELTRGAERILGVTGAKARGSRLDELLADFNDANSLLAEELHRAVVEGGYRAQRSLYCGDGVRRTVDIEVLTIDRAVTDGLVLILTDVTASSEIQEMLGDTKLLLSEVQELSGVGSYEVDLHTWQGHCSDALCRIYGFENDEPLRDFRAFCQRYVHPDDMDLITRSREALLRNGGTDEFEYRYLHPDGGERVFLVRRRVICDSQNHAIRIGGTVQDITARKRVEATLRASETHYRTLLDHATDAFFLMRRGGIIVDLNERASASLGYPREELIGQLPIKFSAKLTNTRLAEISDELDAGRSLTYESIHTRKDGTTFPVEVRIRPFWLEGERFAITLIRDLTEGKRAEKSLRDREERYRLALDTVQLGTWRHDLKTNLVSLDPRCQAHWGVTGSSMAVEELLQRIHPADQEFVRSSVIRAYAGEEADEQLSIEFRIMAASGNVRWISVRAIVHFEESEDGPRVVSTVGTTLDITRPRFVAAGLKGQNRVFERIATGEPLSSVLDDISNLIEEQIPESFCSILLLDRAGSRLRLGAGGRLPAAYNAAIDGITIGPTVGSCGRAAWFRSTVVTADIQADPCWADYRELAAEHGLRSCWSVPIFSATHTSGKSAAEASAVGTLAIYRPFPGSPDRRAQLALASASHLAGVAIGSDRAVQDIRDSEARYAMISEITRSVTFGMSRNSAGRWSVDWARPHFGMLSGYSQEEIQAKGWGSLFLGEDAGRVQHLLEGLLTGGLIKEEMRYLTKAGEVLDVQVQAGLVEFNEEKGTASIIGGLLDITEFKQIEKALRKSEERFHLAMLGANDGLWDWNLRTNEVFYSPRWKAMLGYHAEELEDNIDTWVSLLHPDDAAHAQQQMQSFLRACLDKYEMEFRLRHRDGTYRNIQSRGFLSRDNGEPLRLVGTCRDLTEQKRAELALQRSEEFLRRAQMMAHVGSWSFNWQSCVFECSAESARIYGLAGRSCSLQVWEGLVHPDDLSRVREAFLKTQNGVPFEQEHRLVVRGVTKWVSVKASVEADAREYSSHLIGVTQDVSSRRRLEEQLRHSQKMEAFGQLAGGVAHDFNNLLTVINGFSEILLDETGSDDPRYHCIQQIREAGERAAVLTRQLLMLSRRQSTEPKVIGLNKIVARSESMLRRLIGQDIIIETVLDEHLPLIKADPGQIDQVLLNLVVNARDAMPHGGILRIETKQFFIDFALATQLEEEVDAGPYVEISVADNGVGMSEEVRARIYEPFFSTKGVGKGTGLGLATVYGIVKQNHGSISVESHPGAGTTFRILLPVSSSDMLSPDDVDTVRQPMRGTETVLLAEDEPLVRQLAVMSLNSLGYTILEADSGESALKIASEYEGPLNLLITDVVMPSISGTELARRLRLLHPNIRVLYMSGYTDDAVVRDAAFTEYDDFLQKPFTPLQLGQKVQELLDVNVAVTRQ